MGIEIPGWLRWVSEYVVGEDWPEGDETAMRRLADGWQTMATAIDTVDDPANIAMRDTLAGIEGDTSTAIEERWKLVGSGEGELVNLKKFADSLVDQLENGANDIEKTKYTIIAALAVLAVELTAALATAWTGVGAAAGVAARAATQVTIKMVIRQLIQRLIARAGAQAARRALWKEVLIQAGQEALEEVVIEGGAQAIQAVRGDRDEADVKSIVQSGVGGAVGGAVGVGVGKKLGDTPVGELGGEMVGGIAGNVAGIGAGAAMNGGQGLDALTDLSTYTSGAAGVAPSAVRSAGGVDLGGGSGGPDLGGPAPAGGETGPGPNSADSPSGGESGPSGGDSPANPSEDPPAQPDPAGGAVPPAGPPPTGPGDSGPSVDEPPQQGSGGPANNPAPPAAGTPEQPNLGPSQPDTESSQPDAVPSQPSMDSGQPDVAPSQPNLVPNQPDVVPSQPNLAPSEPSVVPNQPDVAPSQPTVGPSQPDVAPSQPNVVPDQPNLAPSQPNLTTPGPNVDNGDAGAPGPSTAPAAPTTGIPGSTSAATAAVADAPTASQPVAATPPAAASPASSTPTAPSPFAPAPTSSNTTPPPQPPLGLNPHAAPHPNSPAGQAARNADTSTPATRSDPSQRDSTPTPPQRSAADNDPWIADTLAEIQRVAAMNTNPHLDHILGAVTDTDRASTTPRDNASTPNLEQPQLDTPRRTPEQTTDQPPAAPSDRSQPTSPHQPTTPTNPFRGSGELNSSGPAVPVNLPTHHSPARPTHNPHTPNPTYTAPASTPATPNIPTAAPTPTPAPTTPTHSPVGPDMGHVGPDGVRRFGNDAAGQRFGEQQLGRVFHSLPQALRDAVYNYTRQSMPNPFLRDNDPAAAAQRHFDAVRDATRAHQELSAANRGTMPETARDLKRSNRRLKREARQLDREEAKTARRDKRLSRQEQRLARREENLARREQQTGIDHAARAEIQQRRDSIRDRRDANQQRRDAIQQRQREVQYQRSWLEFALSFPDPRAYLAHMTNDHARNCFLWNYFGGEPTADAFNQRIDELDAALNQPLPEAVQAVRGLHDVGFLNSTNGTPIGNIDPTDIDALRRALVGTEQTEQGVMSTSLGANPATVDGQPFPIRMTFDIPAGAPGLWMGTSSAYPDQRELILPRGVRYRVVGVERVDIPGVGPTTVIRTEVVPSSPPPPASPAPAATVPPPTNPPLTSPPANTVPHHPIAPATPLQQPATQTPNATDPVHNGITSDHNQPLGPDTENRLTPSPTDTPPPDTAPPGDPDTPPQDQDDTDTLADEDRTGTQTRDLTDSEREAVRCYTDGGEQKYGPLNQSLRDGAELTPEQQQLATELSNALNALPAREGTVWRGADGLNADDVSRYVPGQLVTERAFTSTSQDRRKRFPGYTEFIVHSRSGRDISGYSDRPTETEVLFDRDTTFEVRGVVEYTEGADFLGNPIQRRRIYLYETDPDHTEPSVSSHDDTESDARPALADVRHAPNRTAIGGDEQTNRVFENLRNEGDHDVVVHGNRFGRAVPGHEGEVDVRAIADAIRSNPDYVPGTPVRLVSCHAGNEIGWAQALATELGAPVRAATDSVGVRQYPDSPAVVRDGGQWQTFHPTDQDGHTPDPTPHQPWADWEGDSGVPDNDTGRPDVWDTWDVMDDGGHDPELTSEVRQRALDDVLADCVRDGVEVRSDSEAQEYLDYCARIQGMDPSAMQAVTLGDDLIMIRPEHADNVRVLREEWIHTQQNRAGAVSVGAGGSGSVVENEIEARERILENQEEWGITDSEVDEIRREIAQMRETGRY